MSAHIVKLRQALVFETPAEFAGASEGYTGDAVVDEASGGVQMGFRVARLEPGGRVTAHVHSFEESVYVVDGELIVDTPDGAGRMGAGDYGLLPVGVTHALRNTSDALVEFAEMRSDDRRV